MKKKIFWEYLILLLSVACTFECPHCYSPNYVEKDRIPTLIIGDTILFKSNFNTMDSFLISNVFKKEFYTDGKFTSDYYTVSYTRLNYVCPFENYYNCPKYRMVVEWDRTYIWWYYFYKGLTSSPQSIDMEINGVVYYDVKNISADTTNLKPEDVVKLYFNDQQGVLDYTLKSGEHFERIK